MLSKVDQILRECQSLVNENQLLKQEVLVARRASAITAKLVVKQFEKIEQMLKRLEEQVATEQSLKQNLAEKLSEAELREIELAASRTKAESALAELEMAHEHLKELDRLKSGFLSSVSHELRTPLTSVLGFARLIRNDFSKFFSPLVFEDKKLSRKSDTILSNLDIILDEGQRLTRLINELLDLAKIESGKIEWKDSLVSLPSVINRAVDAVRGQFAERPQVKLLLNVPVDLPLVNVDRDRLVQVVINLLNNAAKFTDAGRVEVQAEMISDGQNSAIRVSVSDTGPGIPETEIERIFDQFHQVTKQDTLRDKPQGTGLGLAICRQIVEHYQGRIWVESKLGQGSTFSFILPAHMAAPSAEAAPEEGESPLDRAPSRPSRQKPLIEVVDDDPAVLRFISQLLEEQGFEVITARDGQQALDVARRQLPDLITMDLAMPVMDGRTAIGLLREDEQLRQVPVVVISALPDLGQAGGDVALAKPLDEAKLLKTVNALLFTDTTRLSPCLVVTTSGRATRVPEIRVCTGQTSFCSPEELWRRIEDGFEGTVVIPSEVAKEVELDRLCGHHLLQMVIVSSDAY